MYSQKSFIRTAWFQRGRLMVNHVIAKGGRSVKCICNRLRFASVHRRMGTLWLGGAEGVDLPEILHR